MVYEAVEWASHTTQFNEKAWRIRELYEIEINSLISNPTTYIDITDVIETKMKAVKAYTTQLEKNFSIENYYEDFTSLSSE